MTNSQATPNAGPVVQSRAAAASSGATVLSAVVSAEGTLIRGKHVISTSKVDIPDGAYEVIFDRDVRNGTYVATIGKTDAVGVEPSGEITVAGRFSDPRGVFVATNDSSGNFSDRSFHLIVVCPEGFA